MKKYFTKLTYGVAIVAAILFATGVVYGMKSPFPPWLLDLTGDVTVSTEGVVTIDSGVVSSSDIVDGTIVEGDIRDYDNDGLNLYRVAKGSFAVAVGGAVGTGSVALGITLPAKSLVKHSYAFAQTRVQTTTGNPTIKIGCTDDISEFMNVQTQNFFGLAVNSTTNLLQTDDASAARFLSAACTPFATIASGSFSQGVLNVFIEYLKTD